MGRYASPPLGPYGVAKPPAPPLPPPLPEPAGGTVVKPPGPVGGTLPGSGGSGSGPGSFGSTGSRVSGSRVSGGGVGSGSGTAADGSAGDASSAGAGSGAVAAGAAGRDQGRGAGGTGGACATGVNWAAPTAGAGAGTTGAGPTGAVSKSRRAARSRPAEHSGSGLGRAALAPARRSTCPPERRWPPVLALPVRRRALEPLAFGASLGQGSTRRTMTVPIASDS